MRLLVLTSDDLAVMLPDAFPEAEILTSFDPTADGPPTAAVVDPASAADLDASGVPRETPVVWWVPPDIDHTELLALTDSRPSTVLFQPGDPSDVARTLRHMTADAPAAAPDDAARTTDELWERFRDTMLDRLADIDGVAADVVEGDVVRAEAEAALLAAHNLHGSLGTFGLDRGSRLAAELEALLEPVAEGAADPDTGLRIAELTVEIRREVEEREPAFRDGEPGTGEGRGSRLLVVEPDRRRAEAMVEAAAIRGLRPLVARDLGEAEERFRAERPAALIVDPDAGTAGQLESLMKAAALGRPRVPVVVHSRSGHMEARARATRLGARGFVEKAAHPDMVVASVAELIARATDRDATVLIVDDDVAMLELVSSSLRATGLRVRALDQPGEFWRTLELVRPDLVILDIDMPEYSGLQLCRMIRADTAWANLPVVLLTARTDIESYRRGYRAGADDFIPKPLQPDEIVARVVHRLDRTGLADGRDPLTGLPRARLFRSLLALQISLARYHDEPVSLARFGLRSARDVPRFVRQLRASLGPADLVGRWGTVDVVVARYGWDGTPPEDWLDEPAPPIAFVGTAGFPDHGDAAQLLDAAERAMRRLDPPPGRAPDDRDGP